MIGREPHFKLMYTRISLVLIKENGFLVWERLWKMHSNVLFALLADGATVTRWKKCS